MTKDSYKANQPWAKYHEVYKRLEARLADRPMASEFTEQGISVLQKRYTKRDDQKKLIETPQQLFGRVASYVACGELNYNNADEEKAFDSAKNFYDLMTGRLFMPNSPTLMNAGREMGMMSACFVLPVGDSVDDIFDGVKYAALIQKAGGGTGFAFDRLRPTGDYIKTSGGTTSGPLPFMRVYAAGTEAIQQGAFRRGANMGMMNLDHPDILKFLELKKDPKSPDSKVFSNFNFSPKISDSWMEEFLADPNSPHIVVNPRTNIQYYFPKSLDIMNSTIDDLLPVSAGGVDPSKIYTKADIWSLIIHNAWRSGEPGIAFIDKMNKDNPTPHIGRIESTNPCGEQPLLPYEACNLGSINLSLAAKDGKIDYNMLRNVTHQAVRFLDDVIDMNNFPLEEITKMVQGNRKIGLGVMGFGDLLAQLKVPYASNDALKLAEDVMGFINRESVSASEDLARERGVFPNYSGSIFDGKSKRRNATVTTIAPTGSISIISGAYAGGIEPFFSITYTHTDADKKVRKFLVPYFKKDAEEAGVDVNRVIADIDSGKNLSELSYVPQELREIYASAGEIAPEWHVRMQAAFQRHVDNAVSKTVNLPQSASVADVDKVFKLAYNEGCKGITIYRDHCRDEQVLNVGASSRGKARSSPYSNLKRGQLIKIPSVMPGIRFTQPTPFGNLHSFVVYDPRDENRIVEIFGQIGKGGDIASADLEAIGRLVSIGLRGGLEEDIIIDQLAQIGSKISTITRDGQISSLGDAFGVVMKKAKILRESGLLDSVYSGGVDYERVGAQLSESIKGSNHKNGNSHSAEMPLAPIDNQEAIFGLRCESCGAKLIIEGGCLHCSDASCGWSKCS